MTGPEIRLSLIYSATYYTKFIKTWEVLYFTFHKESGIFFKYILGVDHFCILFYSYYRR